MAQFSAARECGGEKLNLHNKPNLKENEDFFILCSSPWRYCDDEMLTPRTKN